MSEDQETSPLLGHSPQVEVVPDAESAVGHKDRYERHWMKWFIICILIVVLISLAALGAVMFKKLPSQDAIQESVIQVSNWQIEKINVDGWRKGKRLNNEDGDALQLTVRMSYWPDYDEWIADNNTSLTLDDKKFYRSLSERFVKNVCLAVNNATTYDGSQTNDNILGALQVKDSFCVDLRNDVRTHLNLTVLVEPRMDKIIDVLKKIWRHQFDKLDISSDVDLSLSRRTKLLPNGWKFPLGRLSTIRIEWERILKWDSVKNEISRLRHRFSSIVIQNFSLRDSTNGFRIETTTEPLPLDQDLEFLELPEGSVIPFIDWEVRVADCEENFKIDLPNVFCFTDSIEIRDEIQLKAFADIEGSLPERLLSQVCWSDEENAFTPMTLLLNKVLNASETLTFQVRGHAVDSKKNNNSLVPYNILQPLLNGMSFFPVTTNFTINSADLIQGITISKLRAKWVRGLFGEKKLSVTGTFIGTISLPFYESSKDQISVKYIKGRTQLYHQDVHFLTVPMSYWSKASSEIYRDESNTTTLMELSVEVRDDEVEIVNNLELTRVLNEVLFKGEAQVHLESDLDLLVSSPLGEMVLMGLNGEGNATLYS